MPLDAKPRNPVELSRHRWSLLCAVAIGVCGLTGFIIAALAVAVFRQPDYAYRHLSYYETQSFNVLIECVAALSAGYAAVVVCKRSGRGFWSSIQWRGSYIEVGTFAAIGILFSVIVRFAITRHVALRMTTGSILLMTLIVLGTVVLQPFIEEIYFRGILFICLAERLGSLAGICVVTVIFVLCHPQHYWIVLPVSIVLGLLRVCTQSTANCYALHAGYNLGVILWGLR
jgi:membrane protease YdiL (CAAX protease family)